MRLLPFLNNKVKHKTWFLSFEYSIYRRKKFHMQIHVRQQSPTFLRASCIFNVIDVNVHENLSQVLMNSLRLLDYNFCMFSVSVGLIWDSDSPEIEHISEVLQCIGTILTLQDVSAISREIFVILHSQRSVVRIVLTRSLL